MNSEGFRGVPGVPEGWELVAISQMDNRQWSIDDAGKPFQWRGEKSNGVYPIIRKVETPKKYRPFANAGEFKPHRDRWVKIASGDNDCGFDIDEADVGEDRRIDGCNEHSVCIWEGWMTFRDAFKCFTFDDGTPFGVEVTGE